MILPTFDFIKKNSQFAYSLILIVLVPSALVFNTLWTLRAVNRDVNFQLRREAVLVGSAIGNMSEDELENSEILNNKFARIQKEEPEIQNITVLIPDEENKFVSAASTNPLGEAGSDPVLSQFVWSSGQPHAAEVIDRPTNKKAWSVIAPIKNESGKQTALVDVKISTQKVDEVISRTIRDSLIVLSATVVVVLLLLINHFRFFEYARLFRRLKEVDQMKDDFISMASHELRTPLTAIRGFTQLLLREPSVSGSEKAKKHAETIAAGSDRLSNLVEDLLNVSRIEQNRMKFEMKPTKLDFLISTVLNELRVQVEQKELRLEFTPLDPQPNIIGDDDRLKQVFINIIGNAVKYTKEGEVTVTQKVEGKALKTFVKDTGIGMSPEARERLFEKFYRIQSDETKEITGTGLGLWITKQIVEKMKGRIFVDSIEGRGSQFTVVLPLAG
jgi:signal transduction histidine kinase